MKSIWDTEELANHWSLSFEEVQFLLVKVARPSTSKPIGGTSTAVAFLIFQWQAETRIRQGQVPCQRTGQGARLCQPRPVFSAEAIGAGVLFSRTTSGSG